MNQIQQRLFICGSDERIEYLSHQITHLITIANPGVDSFRPSWFQGAHLELHFGDVASEVDANHYKTTTPCISDIQRSVYFFRDAWSTKDSRVLISCDYGASRSPALAYILLADHLGVDHEIEAFRIIMEIRPEAVPNSLIVRLGDVFLKRDGALFTHLKDLHDKINAELFPGMI